MPRYCEHESVNLKKLQIQFFAENLPFIHEERQSQLIHIRLVQILSVCIMGNGGSAIYNFFVQILMMKSARFAAEI